MDHDDRDLRLERALRRYEVISPYIAAQPERGQKRKLLEQLAARRWTDERGEPMEVSAETIRSWVRRYRRGGLGGLKDKTRARRGVQALTAQQVELVYELKREVPERSLDRIISIAEGMKLIEPGVLRRSTLHRVLQAQGLSARRCQVPDVKDLDRFEAVAANGTWQSDMLVGPWLPDPQRPGKMRRAYLYAFLDDHCRLLLHGRFSFKGDLPALELVFRRCLQKWGVPRRVHYDNGQVYRSGHMKQIVATLGIHRIVFTKPRRPMGHGKIEALNQYIRSAFLSELAASKIETLDALNEAFIAWADEQYNRKTHCETGQAPLERWREDAEKIRYADEEELRLAFLWREKRTPDKTAVFSLFGRRYQVGANLARRRVEVRYDPEALDEVEVWHQDRFIERARPFEVREHRRARAPELRPQEPKDESKPPAADWLGHLVEQRRQRGFVEPPPRAHVEQRQQQRVEADEAIVALLRERFDEAVIDTETIGDSLERFGPFDADRARVALDRLLEDGVPSDIHITVALDAINADAQKGEGR